MKKTTHYLIVQQWWNCTELQSPMVGYTLLLWIVCARYDWCRWRACPAWWSCFHTARRPSNAEPCPTLTGVEEECKDDSGTLGSFYTSIWGAKPACSRQCFWPLLTAYTQQPWLPFTTHTHTHTHTVCSHKHPLKHASFHLHPVQ